MFEANELGRIIDACGVPLKAMVLLGINAGFGNTDCASLPLSAVDLKNGWINFPRPKTEIQRRIPLWPETTEALRDTIDQRPVAKSKDDADCVFLTSTGRRWVRVQPNKKDPSKSTPLDALSQKFARLLKSLNINGRRNFYALRHGFETIGGESRDQVAVNAVMGHVDSSMAATYRERISDERLQAVANVVHAWLFDEKA